MEIPEKDLAVFQKNPLFTGMDGDGVRTALAALKAERMVYPRNAVIHAAGTPMDRFALVLSGMAQVCVDDIEGSRMIMAEVVPGVTFGESLCYLRVRESPVYAFAAEETRILWLSPDILFSAEEDAFRAELCKRFTAMLARKTLSMNSRIQVLSRLGLREKLTAYFTELAAAQGSDLIRLPMNREDTAAYIGANRSALSRELARMKKDGLIDYHRETVRVLR